MSAINFEDLEVGEELPTLELKFTRADLIAYANASGDQNPIHQDEEVAKSVGLPDVISHGMLTMGRAIRVVTDWISDPTAVVDYSVRMTRPVVVPNNAQGATVVFSGKVGEINADRSVRIDLSAVCDGTTVLGQAKAIVKFDTAKFE
jgi:acyl dehydratase